MLLLHCASLLGTVKKCGLLKILHDKYKHNRKAGDAAVAEFVQTFECAMENNKEIESLLTKTQVLQLCNMHDCVHICPILYL